MPALAMLQPCIQSAAGREIGMTSANVGQHTLYQFLIDDRHFAVIQSEFRRELLWDSGGMMFIEFERWTG